MPEIIDEQLRWDEKDNSITLITKYKIKNGEMLQVTPLDPEEAARKHSELYGY